MKKVRLTQVNQYGQAFYIGKYDPRVLVMLADQSIDVGSLQEAQRPLEKQHLQELSEYVSPREKGMLPASVMLGTKDRNRLVVEKETEPDGEISFFMWFPQTPEEIREYENTIDIIDGQHRLFAFSDRYRDEEMKDDVVYEMAFSLFITPSVEMRRRLFTVTNEKQKAVNGNLLLYLKSKLGMLNQAEKQYYPIVNSLATEPCSPLKGRIIMSAEKITKGYKAKELIKILDKAKIGQLQVNHQLLTAAEQVKAISTYLSAWESFYGRSYTSPGKETMTKISGLRYVLLLMPTFLEYAVTRQKKFEQEFVRSVIQKMEDYKGLGEEETLFDRSLEFRGEGATIKMAEDDATGLKAYLASSDSNGFNPLA